MMTLEDGRNVLVKIGDHEIDEFINKKLGLTNDETEGLQISDETMHTVLEGMRSVTEGEGGTAYR